MSHDITDNAVMVSLDWRCSADVTGHAVIMSLDVPSQHPWLWCDDAA